MAKPEILERLRDSGALGIIRVQTAQDLVQIAKALHEGGLSCLEITMTTPGALRAIEEAREELPDVLMGAGTVLDAATARQAILAGAQFLVTPTVELDVIETAHRYGVSVIPGAMTPTEILTCWEAGAGMVKVFPASVLGPNFIRAVHGPLPQIPLVPPGGSPPTTPGNSSGPVRSWCAPDRGWWTRKRWPREVTRFSPRTRGGWWKRYARRVSRDPLSVMGDRR